MLFAMLASLCRITCCCTRALPKVFRTRANLSSAIAKPNIGPREHV